LVEQTRAWLGSRATHLHIDIAAHLAGGKAMFEFTVRHCTRQGAIKAWETEATWQAVAADERDEPVTTLASLEPAEEVAEELAQHLSGLVEKV
jgi:hypothetical protein